MNAAGAYLGIGEVARRLGRSRTGVQRLVDSGRLPSVRTPGGHRRIPEAALLAYAAGGAVDTDAGDEIGDGPHVLVADDDGVAAAFVRHVVRRHVPGSRVTVVGNGRDAVAELERRRPDFLVTDLNMAALDGFRLAWLLLVKAELRGIGLLVVSTLSREQIEQRGGLPPGVAYMRKPMPAGELAAFLRERLGWEPAPISRTAGTGPRTP